MAKVSIIIPSRNERFLQKTIDDIFEKATGDIEVIAILDGYWPTPPLKDHDNQVIIHKGEGEGMRPGINSGAYAAKGKYILKTDGHCMFEKGFDEVLQKDCDYDWVVVPRRRSLDPEKWEILQNGKAPVDMHYLSYPYAKVAQDGYPSMHGEVWKDRARERINALIDDEMSSQGSCWFMQKDYFWKFGGLSSEGYGTFIQEFQEIGLRAWLSGGRVVCNKNTWYAHLHKGKTYGRGYYISQKGMIDGAKWSADYWMNNRWKDRKHDIAWLIDKFWPVPTWPENWKELKEWEKYK